MGCNEEIELLFEKNLNDVKNAITRYKEYEFLIDDQHKLYNQHFSDVVCVLENLKKSYFSGGCTLEEFSRNVILEKYYLCYSIYELLRAYGLYEIGVKSNVIEEIIKKFTVNKKLLEITKGEKCLDKGFKAQNPIGTEWVEVKDIINRPISSKKESTIGYEIQSMDNHAKEKMWSIYSRLWFCNREDMEIILSEELNNLSPICLTYNDSCYYVSADGRHRVLFAKLIGVKRLKTVIYTN